MGQSKKNPGYHSAGVIGQVHFIFSRSMAGRTNQPSVRFIDPGAPLHALPSAGTTTHHFPTIAHDLLNVLFQFNNDVTEFLNLQFKY
jgi:hypothetical protein